MPIEDVDFLSTNSVVDSAVLLLDSDARDRHSHPTPSEYCVNFDPPMKLVVGLEVLAATVPASMYVVDTHNYELSFATLQAPSDGGDGVAARGLFSALAASCDAFATAFTDTSVTSLYTCLVQDDGLGTVAAAAAAAATILHSPSRFTMVVRTYESYASYDFPSLDAMNAIAHGGATASAILTVRKAVVRVEIGNHDVVSLMPQIVAAMRGAGSGVDDTAFQSFNVIPPSSNASVTLQGRYVVYNTAVPFVIDAGNSTFSAVAGFDTLPRDDAATTGLGYAAMRVPIDGCTKAGLYDDAVFGSVSSTTVASTSMSRSLFATSPAHVVVAPGVANLLAVPFIVLRCPEIEQHYDSTAVYGGQSTGIALFTLPAANEVSNLRFDFVTVVRKPFHAVGKLSRLTLRFERGDGSLYDFKGVNNQILVSVKFLSAGKRVPLSRSVLNGDYDPDFLRYTLRQGAEPSIDTFASRQTGLVPSRPSCPAPFDDDADEYAADDEEDQEEQVEREDREDGAAVTARRQDIARRLLAEQDKYDYPALEEDYVAWRAA